MTNTSKVVSDFLDSLIDGRARYSENNMVLFTKTTMIVVFAEDRTCFEYNVNENGFDFIERYYA